MTTEATSHYDHLEKMTTRELLEAMNSEDQSVPLAVARAIDQIEQLTDAALARMQDGGRVFYIGAGTSGRLGILDASEIPPTYGAPKDWIIGLIAGGDYAIRHAVENAEDDAEQAWRDLSEYQIGAADVLIGIAASGRTPYVIGGLKRANEEGCLTGCIVCNGGSEVAAAAQLPIEVVVGPEFVTGSTRMKSGTATKLVLNMFSTALMIRMGRVQGNKMVDMQLSNYKLVQRSIQMVMQTLAIEAAEAETLLLSQGSVRQAVEYYQKQHSR